MVSDNDKVAMDEVKKLAICVYSDLMGMDRMLRSMDAGRSDDPVLSLVYDEVHAAMGAIAIVRDLLCVARKRGASHGVRKYAGKAAECR